MPLCLLCRAQATTTLQRVEGKGTCRVRRLWGDGLT